MSGLKKGVTMSDMALLQGAAMVFQALYSPEAIPPMVNDTADAINGANQYRSGVGLNLTEEGGKKYTDWARKWAEQYERKRDDNPCPQHTQTRKMLNQLLKFYESKLNLMASGTSEANNPELANDEGQYLIETFIPQMNTRCFDRKNWQKTEQYLKTFPLGTLLEKANDLHDKNVDFYKNRNSRTLSENKAKLEEIRQKKEQLLSTVESLYEKASKALAKNSPAMEDVATGLFGKKEQLFAKDSGFIGDRGLQFIAERLKKDPVIESAHISLFEQSMEKFDTSRSSIFKKESTEHKQMRESAEKVQKNMKILEAGAFYDEKTKSKIKLTETQRADLMKETYREIQNLEEKTNQYIKHVAPDGKEPRTSAGKARLAGARDMLEIAGMFKTNLVKDPAVQELTQGPKEKAKEKAKEIEKAKKVQSAPQDSNEGPEAVFAEIEGKFKGFKYLSTSYEGRIIRTDVAGSYNLTGFEYMAAQMIATSGVKEAVNNGTISLETARDQIGKQTSSICRDKAFLTWIKDISKDDGAKETLGEMNADGVRIVFTEALSKKMDGADAQKTKDKTADKMKEPVKTEAKTEAKKETKVKTPQKTKTEPAREVGKVV